MTKEWERGKHFVKPSMKLWPIWKEVQLEHICEGGGLQEDATCKKSLQVQTEGSRKVSH